MPHHRDAYAGVVGICGLLWSARVCPSSAEQGARAVGITITGAGAGGSLLPHLPTWPRRRTNTRARHAQSDQVPGMIRAYLQSLERSNPDVCRRAGASGFFFRDGGDAAHSAACPIWDTSSSENPV